MKHVFGRILIVSPDFPYPPNHGGRVDILSRIQALNSNGFEVDLISTVRSNPRGLDLSSMRQWVNNITIVSRHLSVTSGLSTLPFQLKSRQGLSSVSIPNSAYDVVLLESEYVASILENPGLRARSVLLRVHNNEVLYFKELAKSCDGIAKKLFYYSEFLKFRRWCPYIHKRVDALFFISSSEYGDSAFASKAFWLPPSVNIKKIVKHKSSSKIVLFVGSLFMPNNLEGILWYVNLVHESLFDIPGYKLIIAGNNRGLNLDALFSKERIIIYDSPNDSTLENLYRMSSVFVAPMFHGAGVKMKVINAIVAGTPVVATSTSVEGSGLCSKRDLLVCDQPVEFAQCVRSLLCSTEMRAELISNAQSFVAKHYDSANFIQCIANYIVKSTCHQENPIL